MMLYQIIKCFSIIYNASLSLIKMNTNVVPKSKSKNPIRRIPPSGLTYRPTVAPTASIRKKQNKKRVSRPNNKRVGNNNSRALVELRKQMAQLQPLGLNNHPYMQTRQHCKPNPRPSMIPDGSGGKAVIIQAYDRNVIDTNSSTVTFQFSPIFPHCAAVLPVTTGSGLSINGIAMGAQVGSATVLHSLPFSPFKNGASAICAIGSRGSDIYNASTIRFVAINFKITNTSSMLKRQGIISVFQNNLTVSEDEVTATTDAAVTNTGAVLKVYQANNLAIVNYRAPTGSSIRRVEGLVSGAIPSGHVFTRSFAEGATDVRLPHIGSLYHDITFSDQPYALTTGITTGSGNSRVDMDNLFTSHVSTYSNNRGGVLAHDNHWGGAQARIDGLSTVDGTSMMVETFVTYEVTPSNSSAYFPLARARPAANMNLMQAVNNKAQLQPIAEVGPGHDPR
jgi:hypothetical protein